MERKLYKFNHSVHKGGYLYAHKIKGEIIKNKDGLRNALNAISKKYELIDVTIKIYDTIFILFFMIKPSISPQIIIDTIQKNLSLFANWDEEYAWASFYELQENYIRAYLKKLGFNYDEG